MTIMTPRFSLPSSGSSTSMDACRTPENMDGRDESLRETVRNTFGKFQGRGRRRGYPTNNVRHGRIESELDLASAEPERGGPAKARTTSDECSLIDAPRQPCHDGDAGKLDQHGYWHLPTGRVPERQPGGHEDR